MANVNPLASLVRAFAHTDARAVARHLEGMDEGDVVAALRELSPTSLAPAFPHLQAGFAASLLAAGDEALFRAVVQEVGPERAARLFTLLPEGLRARFGPQLTDEARRELADLVTYPADSVGSVMSRRFLAFRMTEHVRDVIGRLRSLSRRRAGYSYTYVTDEEDRLVGVLNMYELIVAEPSAQLATVMNGGDVFRVDPFMERRAAADELGRRKFFAAPVVDGQGRLLGVIRAEQLIGDARQEVAADLLKMVGVGAEERAFTTLGASLRQRLPWLHVNLVTAFMAAAVVAFFENVIAKLTVLAVFLPVVAGQGGNAGAQSLAVVMRGLVMREIPRDRVGELIRKEALLGAISGLATGLVTGLVAWLWQGNAVLGLVIGLGMLVNLAAAGLAGASIPVLMKRLGWDPSQSSNIILTTVTDIVGFFAFLGFAVVFERWLVT